MCERLPFRPLDKSRLGEHRYYIIKTIKDYDLNQLGEALNFSIGLKQELYNAEVGGFYDICWGIGGSSIGKKSSGYDSLDSLELTVRSYNALKRAGINAVDELRKLSLEELRNIRNLGQKCFEEIVSKLADKGYVLSDESDDDRIDDEFEKNEDSKYEEELIKEYEKHYGEVELDEEDNYDGEDSESLSGDDIETQDDWEVWQRFINGEGG